MTYQQVIDIVNQTIKRNNNEDITGPVLNSVIKVLLNFSNDGFININDVINILSDQKMINILGNVTTDMSSDIINSLPEGVYYAEKSGVYNNLGGIVVKEGYYTLLRKKNNEWSIESEVLMPYINTSSINSSNNFINGVYVNENGYAVLKYTDSQDAFCLKIPIYSNTPINIYTYPGAFSPAMILNNNNIITKEFTEKNNYLENPLKIIPIEDGFLCVNAHEVTTEIKQKLRVDIGFPQVENRIRNIEDNLNISDFELIKLTIKKNGNIGVDCDFTDLKVAVNSINDSSSKKRYILYVLDGDYDYSNDGDLIGIRLKNYVTIKGQSYNTRIIKRDSVFDWDKSTIDKVSGDVEHIELLGPMTIISNNCKCPIHIDSDYCKRGIFENLNLINEQPLGTGDNPSDGQANCFALGWRYDDYITVSNVTANGKIWGHNTINTSSRGLLL